MKLLKTYSIPFKGLKLGKHQFDFEITNAFFDEFEYSIVKKGKLTCQVVLEKQETMLLINFIISGTVDRSCDHCLSEFPEPVDVEERQIVKFGEADQEETDDEIIFLKPNDYEFNVSGLIYEYINLAMPLTSVCNDVGNTPFCDQDMLDKLKLLSGNEEQEQNTNPDPRWEVLKKIK